MNVDSVLINLLQLFDQILLFTEIVLDLYQQEFPLKLTLLEISFVP